MKYLAHVPVEQYGFISAEADTPEEAVLEYKSIKRLFEGGTGVGVRKLAEIIAEYCKTGGIVNGGNHDFSASEQLLIAELRRILRKSN